MVGHKGSPYVQSLGPMPDAVGAVVRRLVAEARQNQRSEADERLNGFCLTGGPGA
jgi:hypothetical protein